MSLSLKMRAVLLMARLAGGKPLHELPVAEARQATVMRIPKSRTSVPLASITNRAIPGPAGDIPIRIYTPEGAGPFPLLIYFHGGGFVVGSIDGSDEICRALCWGAGCMVVSVGYRLAPEHKFPAAPDDCLAATRWAAHHAAEFGADPTRLVVAGDSAGGNLAAVTALRLRDEGGPPLCGQLLIYPVTDYHTPPTPSYLANANGYLLTRAMMVWFWGHYLNHAGEADDPHAAPLRAPDLRGLPPALVITAEFDPLRDEGERYAERLQAAGTPAVLARYDGMIHGFLLFADLFDEGRRALDEATKWLRQVTMTGRIGVSVSMDAAFVEDFLAERYGGAIDEVAPLGAGVWSQAFAFRRAGSDYVIRFGAHCDDFARDRLAARFAGPALPVPTVLELGETEGGYYAIAERVYGAYIDDVAEAQMRSLLPALFAALDAMRLADLSHTTGYGGWDAGGNAAYPSWRAALLDVANDRPADRIHGWRARLAASVGGSAPFDAAYRRLHALAGDLPNQRCLIHSDLLHFNVLVQDDRISGVLDWGCAMTGDFLYDLAWLSFWQPWYPAWQRIDFVQEARRHYAAIGLAVPGFDQRLLGCQLHIGLAGMAYQAYAGDWSNLAATAQHTLDLAR